MRRLAPLVLFALAELACRKGVVSEAPATFDVAAPSVSVPAKTPLLDPPPSACDLSKCQAALEVFAKRLGLSAFEREDEGDRTTLSWSDGGRGCEANGFHIYVAHATTSQSPSGWRPLDAPAIGAARDAPSCSVDVLADANFAEDRRRAEAFVAGAEERLAGCLR